MLILFSSSVVYTHACLDPHYNPNHAPLLPNRGFQVAGHGGKLGFGHNFNNLLVYKSLTLEDGSICRDGTGSLPSFPNIFLLCRIPNRPRTLLASTSPRDQFLMQFH